MVRSGVRNFLSFLLLFGGVKHSRKSSWKDRNLGWGGQWVLFLSCVCSLYALFLFLFEPHLRLYDLFFFVPRQVQIFAPKK